VRNTVARPIDGSLHEVVDAEVARARQQVVDDGATVRRYANAALLEALQEGIADNKSTS
jgi:hypothetical protein